MYIDYGLKQNQQKNSIKTVTDFLNNKQNDYITAKTKNK